MRYNCKWLLLKISIYSVIIFSGLMVIGALTITSSEQQMLQEKQFNNEYGFRVSGILVDENNQPISDAIVEIIETTDIWNGDARKRKMTLNSSIFEIASSGGCQIININFSKEGYYSESYSAGFEEFKDAITKKNDMQLSGNVVDIPNRTIKLTSKGILTPNIFRHKFQYYFINNKNQQFNYKLQTYYPFLTSIDASNNQDQYEQKFTVVNESQLPENIIYLWPEYDTENNLIALTLKTNIVESGFIEATDITNTAKFYRNMKTAPETGYQASIIISKNNMKNIYYFYIKIYNYYGKARLIIMDDDAVLTIYLNRDKDGENPRYINIPAN